MKLVINVLSTLILLVHVKPIQYMARVAADGTLSSRDHGAQVQLVVAAGAGLLALLAATGLAVYKPLGMTAYGWNKQYAEQVKSSDVEA